MASRALIYTTLAIASGLMATLAVGAAEPIDPPIGSNLNSTGRNLVRALQNCPLSYQQGASESGSQLQPAKVLTTPNTAGFYPMVGRHLGLQAVIQVHFLIDALGNIRFPHIGYTFPFRVDPAFDAAAIRLVQSYSFAPMTVDGKPVASWETMPVKFLITNGDWPLGTLLRQDAWQDVLKKAGHGDIQSIRAATYVTQLVGASETHVDKTAALALMVESALGGDDSIRLDLVSRLASCGKAVYVEQWVVTDAMAGSAEAQIRWAKMLIESNDAELVVKASEKLHEASASRDEFNRLWVGGLMATAPIEGLRDPALALQIATKLNREAKLAYSDDPDYAELLAAAQAANGQYEAAVQSELVAIKRAVALKWNISGLQSRLAVYQAGKPWQGYLCDCDKLSPGAY